MSSNNQDFDQFDSNIIEIVDQLINAKLDEDEVIVI